MDRPVDRETPAYASWLDAHGMRLLRWSLAVVFLWFGALKVAGMSPVEGLVMTTLPWLPGPPTIFLLGLWEIIIGVLFLVARWMRLALVLFVVQMAGTFLVLVVAPHLAFQGESPVALTTLGEFVVKNLVLLTAGLAVIGRRLAADGARAT